MIINGVMTRTLAHFLGAHADWVHMSPSPFWFLTISSCTVAQVVEGVFGLALGSMTIDVELWDDILHAIQKLIRGLNGWRKLACSLFDIATPLTNDVI
jgi:hypothetical protein